MNKMAFSDRFSKNKKKKKVKTKPIRKIKTAILQESSDKKIDISRAAMDSGVDPLLTKQKSPEILQKIQHIQEKAIVQKDFVDLKDQKEFKDLEDKYRLMNLKILNLIDFFQNYSEENLLDDIQKHRDDIFEAEFLYDRGIRIKNIGEKANAKSNRDRYKITSIMTLNLLKKIGRLKL